MEISGQLMQFSKALALSRVGGDQELLREVAGIFLEETADTMAGLREAVARGDAKAIRHAAHTLKGSAGNFGAEATCAVAQKLETIGASGQLAKAADLLEALDRELNLLRPVIAELTMA